MAKRFTDSRKWNDPWYRKLPSEYKCFWEYILTTCNHAGIWKVDFEMASFCIGKEIDPTCVAEYMSERIEAFSPDKWYIPKFISFQYGELQEGNRVHDSVISILKKEGVCKPLISPLQGDKDKVKVKDKVKDKDKDKKKYAEYVKLSTEEYKKLVDKHSEKWTVKAIDILNIYKGSSGKTYKSDYMAICGWVTERMAEINEKTPKGRVIRDDGIDPEMRKAYMQKVKEKENVI